jgi:chromosomal replication initiation ATPase DnaA
METIGTRTPYSRSKHIVKEYIFDLKEEQREAKEELIGIQSAIKLAHIQLKEILNLVRVAEEAEKIQPGSLEEAVLIITSGCFSIPIAKITSTSRKREIVDTRRFISSYLRATTKLTFKDIGNLFSLHHSNIIHLVSSFENIYNGDPAYKLKCDTASDLINKLKEEAFI